MKTRVLLQGLVYLCYVVCVVLFFATLMYGCASRQKSRDPTIDPNLSWTYTNTCFKPMYVTSDTSGGTLLEQQTRDAVDFWNGATKQHLLEYIGQSDTSPIDRTAPYISVMPVTQPVLKIWKERAKTRQALTCKIDKSKCSDKPNTIIGQAFPHTAHRVSKILLYVPGQIAAYVDPQGPTQYCNIGGRVMYIEAPKYDYIRSVTIVHEIGHIIGLPDVVGGNGIMGDSVGWGLLVAKLMDPETVRDIEFLYGGVGLAW